MSDATVTLLIKASFGLLLIICALVFAIAGIKAFFRGTGIAKLKDHSFAVEYADFKLNTVVSSAGAILLLASFAFGFFGFLSSPTYESTSLLGFWHTKVVNIDSKADQATTENNKVPKDKMATTGPDSNQKIIVVEPWTPVIGSQANTISGDKFEIKKFDNSIVLAGVKSLNQITLESKAWGGAETQGKGLQILLRLYAECISKDPNAKVLFGYADTSAAAVIAKDQIAKNWTEAFQAAGIDKDKWAIVSDAAGESKWKSPSISLVNQTRPCETNWD